MSSEGLAIWSVSSAPARSISGKRTPLVLTNSDPGPAVCGLGADWMGTGNGLGKFVFSIIIIFDEKAAATNLMAAAIFFTQRLQP